MFRRFWIAIITLGVGSSFWTGSLSADELRGNGAPEKDAVGRRTDAAPNVLFIVIDDLNDWVGCLKGHSQAKTPNIDALAAQGMLFTNAHCQAPLCGPSRASILSGLYPHTTGMYQQPKGSKLRNDARNFRGHLLPEYFEKRGYETLGVGKITHGYPLKAAFQRAGRVGGSGPKPAERFDFRPPTLPWSGTQTDWGVYPTGNIEMPDQITAGWAIDQLGKGLRQPFFLAVGFHRPHVPFYTHQEWFDLHPLNRVELPVIHDNDLDDVPMIGRQVHEMPRFPQLDFLRQDDNAQLRRSTQAYLACTSFVDHQVGRVLDALADSSYANNTIIVLLSDHGYHLGEKHRVSKHSLWEESTRVPLIIVRAREIQGGRRCSLPVGLIDLYPTLLELCGLPPRERNEGRSLSPLLDNPNAPWRDAILTTYARDCHALRSAQHRYIQYEDGSEELYDHRSDPHEWSNLAKDPRHAEMIVRFRAIAPSDDAPYHPATSPEPVNAWFEDHYRRNGVVGN